MAKSNLSWSMDVDKGNVIIGSEMVVEILAIKEKLTFDLEDLFPGFMDLDQVQMRCVANGVKQKLADDLARKSDEKLTPVEMKAELQALWDRLVSGYWFKPPSEKVAEKLAREAEAKKAKEVIEKAEKATDPKDIEVLKRLGILPA